MAARAAYYQVYKYSDNVHDGRYLTSTSDGSMRWTLTTGDAHKLSKAEAEAAAAYIRRTFIGHNVLVVPNNRTPADVAGVVVSNPISAGDGLVECKGSRHALVGSPPMCAGCGQQFTGKKAPSHLVAPAPAIPRRNPSSRDPDNSDLNAAARGLGMWGMDLAELDALVALHDGNEQFASRAIVQAARQVAAVKRSRGPRARGRHRRNPARSSKPGVYRKVTPAPARRRYVAKYAGGKVIEFNARNDAAALTYANGLCSRTRAGGKACVSLQAAPPKKKTP